MKEKWVIRSGRHWQTGQCHEGLRWQLGYRLHFIHRSIQRAGFRTKSWAKEKLAKYRISLTELTFYFLRFAHIAPWIYVKLNHVCTGFYDAFGLHFSTTPWCTYPPVRFPLELGVCMTHWQKTVLITSTETKIYWIDQMRRIEFWFKIKILSFRRVDERRCRI